MSYQDIIGAYHWEFLSPVSYIICILRMKIDYIDSTPLWYIQGSRSHGSELIPGTRFVNMD